MSGLVEWAMGLPYSDDAELAKLPAEQKVRIITAMGFVPVRDAHRLDCWYALDEGNICNCVQPATVWTQPKDVDEFRHETEEELRAVPLDQRRIYESER